MDNNFHQPVLLKEVLDFLNVQMDGEYIDCNLGGGGHTLEILRKGGRVLGIDMDEEALGLKIEDDNFTGERGNFVNLDKLAERNNFKEVKGVLFDLGLSSNQLEKGERGFSFLNEGPLDMRMDKTLGVRAMDLINGLNEGELRELFLKLGEEERARIIAKKIVERRKTKPIETTGELADLVAQVLGRRHDQKIHPATKIFQALRIAVNDELNSLSEVLPKALEVLNPGGRIVVISFHSLEDRIVKNFFKAMEEKGVAKILTPKPLEASEEEIAQNPRSRSAKLRVLEKLA